MKDAAFRGVVQCPVPDQRSARSSSDARSAMKLAAHPFLLSSGGGTADRKICLWNTGNGQCLNEVDTKSQVRAANISMAPYPGMPMSRVANLARNLGPSVCVPHIVLDYSDM